MSSTLIKQIFKTLCWIWIFGLVQGNEICTRYDGFVYLCPLDYAEVGGFKLEITPLKEVLINCDGITAISSEMLPKIAMRKINLLQFRYCPLPVKGFAEILNKFNTSEVALIEFENGVVENQFISKELLRDLGSLEFLKLSSNSLKILPSDIFDNTPQLHALELKRNNIVKLEDNLLHSLTLLEWLDISDNNLKEIGVNLFKTLKNLKHLILKNNELQVIHNFAFKDLKNLETLNLAHNKIRFIFESGFADLVQLKNADLGGNNLETISNNLFKNTSVIEKIVLKNNPHLMLTDYLFANLLKLEEIDLSMCNLKQIPEHIFQNSLHLKIVNLKYNELSVIPVLLFQNSDLEEIYLDNNRLENISNLFMGLHKMRILSMSNNGIKSILETNFADLYLLEELNLANNKISKIETDAFANNNQLKIINLSRNLYSEEDNFLKNMIFLEELNFSHNQISSIEDWFNLENKPILRTLDLSYNSITNISLDVLKSGSELLVINLEYNKITVVTIENVEMDSGLTTSVVHLNNNPIYCDCLNYNLLEYLKGDGTTMFNLETDSLLCSGPHELSGQEFKTLSMASLACPFKSLKREDNGCPSKCECIWRPFDRSIIMNCSHRNLTYTPKIFTEKLQWTNYIKIELDLSHNNLEFFNVTTSYDNVTSLFLSYNEITIISYIPSNLEILKLDHNQLTTVNSTFLEKLNNSHLVLLTLDNNPWSCDCSMEHLSNFLRQNSRLNDFKDVFCYDNITRLVDLNKNNLCQDYIFVYSILLMSILLVLTTLTTLYYRYSQEIKIFLYSRNLCLFWVSEEDLDEGKIYDAFISFSHLDEEFVINSLVTQLEAPPNNFKLCLHFRDWIPGEFISGQIVKSVESSRRTIVVLSQNFLQSVWGIAEFQKAHASAMVDGRARVIVVIYGDIKHEDLNDELGAYLKTNTYLKSTENYFWDKLLYAMPHKHKHNV